MLTPNNEQGKAFYNNKANKLSKCLIRRPKTLLTLKTFIDFQNVHRNVRILQI